MAQKARVVFAMKFILLSILDKHTVEAEQLCFLWMRLMVARAVIVFVCPQEKRSIADTSCVEAGGKPDIIKVPNNLLTQ